MNIASIVRRTLAFISMAGATIIVILFGIAMTLYVKDPQNYTAQVVPVILLPFDAVCLVTVVASVVLFELIRDTKLMKER